MADVGNRFIKLFEVLERSKIITSRAEAARRLDYKPQAFNEILKGRTNVGIELVQKICIEYHINPDYLILGIGSPFKEKYAHLNAHFNVPSSGQKSPSEKRGSFKQSLNTGPPPGENKECEKCKEKERTIEAQRTTIYTQQELIKSLKDRIEELTKSSGQKRKAG
jgi:transcriptional regulator with XRE-family HTH domain